jgi:hypothetical protein
MFILDFAKVLEMVKQKNLPVVVKSYETMYERLIIGKPLKSY